MMKKTIVLSSGLLVACAIVLGACASPDNQQGAASGGAATSTTAAPTTGGSTSPSPEPRDQIKVVATGTVQRGVEPGCLILDTGKERYVLLSKDKSKLTAGSRVEVTGVRSAGQISYCQQGNPLEVQSVKPAS
ncbi:MAG TPA: hypothetical protein VF486_09060 [Actinomycetes bacterium]